MSNSGHSSKYFKATDHVRSKCPLCGSFCEIQVFGKIGKEKAKCSGCRNFFEL